MLNLKFQTMITTQDNNVLRLLEMFKDPTILGEFFDKVQECSDRTVCLGDVMRELPEYYDDFIAWREVRDAETPEE